jgi:hypothetical protein
MEQDIKKEVEEIIGRLQCPKDFKCYRLGFKDLCKAKDTGLKSFLECLEEDPRLCTFSVRILPMRMGGSYYCECPLRIYIAKKLKK